MAATETRADSMQRFDGGFQLDQQLEAAQAALLARHAPDTRVRRLAWSHGETQVLELGAGPPLLLVHGAMSDACVWAPILPELARHTVSSQSTCRATGWRTRSTTRW